MATKGALNGYGDSSHIEQVAVDLDTVAEKIDMEAKGYAELEIQKETHEVLDDPDARKYERRYLRKLDMIILPTVSGLYFFEYLDRGNVAVSSSFPRLREPLLAILDDVCVERETSGPR